MKEGTLNFETPELIRRYREYYGCSEREARQAMGTLCCNRLLNLLARDAGLLERTVTEALEEERIRLKTIQEDLAGRSAYLEKLESELAEQKRRIAESNRVVEQAQTMETAEMRDRIRALEIFKRVADGLGVKNPGAVLNGCAGILAGSFQPAAERPRSGWPL